MWQNIAISPLLIALINANNAKSSFCFTQTNTKITVKGKGTKIFNKNGYGDLIVTIEVELPKSLDRAQKLLIEKLDSDIDQKQYTKKNQYNQKIK